MQIRVMLTPIAMIIGFSDSQILGFSDVGFLEFFIFYFLFETRCQCLLSIVLILDT
jgi:hypothetical protein